MAIPAAFAIPATLAYLNARWRLPVDWNLLSNHARALYLLNDRQNKDTLNCFYLLEEHAHDKQTANKIFLLYQDQKYTFREFYNLTLRYAGWLHDTYKITKDEVVAMDFMNGPQFLLLLMAIWSLGATPAFMNYNLTGGAFIHSVKTSSARLLIVEAELAPKILTEDVRKSLADPEFRQGMLPIDVKVFDQAMRLSVEWFEQYRAPDTVRTAMDPRETCVLISTSGTTGLPKQSVVPWGRMLGAAIWAGGWLGLGKVTARKPDVFYTPMPLYHSSAFLGFMICLVNPTTLALSRRFSASIFWSEVRLHQATVVQYVGETLRYLTNAPVQQDEKNHQVRIAFGNGLRPDVWKNFKARFGIETVGEFYAATEGVAASWNLNRNDCSDGAIGQTGLISDLLMKRSQAIVKVNWESEAPWRDPITQFCEKLPRGEPGELLFKLDPADVEAKYSGYLGNEQATQAKILWNVFEPGDAWYRTGDVVRWDSDGRLWFYDRIGDTFRWKSENVSTAEVGELMGRHRQVLEANVYGVKIPGHEGRAGCAALVLRPSAFVGEPGSMAVKPEVLQSLAKFTSKALPRYSVPVFIRIVREMITTGNNKPQKNMFRAQGIDLDSISKGRGGDRLYWLKAGSTAYEPFERSDWDTLRAGKARL